MNCFHPNSSTCMLVYCENNKMSAVVFSQKKNYRGK